jgi:hypothetical protein
MRTLPVLAFVAALSPSLAWIPPAAAQASRPGATLSFAQAERNAVDLRQGMSAEEVHKLLGTPRRTALKTNGSSVTTPWQGTLQWTYSWPGAASSQGSLNVVFAATAPEKWYVNSWEWSSY